MANMERAALAADRDFIGNRPKALLLPALSFVFTGQQMRPLA